MIDCDLRKGSLRRHCAISGKVIGLSEALTGQSGEIIYPTANPYLDVVFSGKRPPNPSELLSGDMFGTILDELKKAYDYIIIDTPPMTACIDAAIVGRMSDGVVLVVRNEMVRKKDLRKVKSQLQRNGARVLGVVLNGVKKNQVDYSGYGHYGHYGEEEVA